MSQKKYLNRKSSTTAGPENLVDGKYSLKDLVDIEALEKMFRRFSEINGFATGLISYPDQELLIATDWLDICKRFHRADPRSKSDCQQTILELTSELNRSRELNIRQCRNCLVSGATPIIIEDVHLANLFTGQVLLEEPDLESFRNQGREYGYDVDAYLEALAEVPVVTGRELSMAISLLSDMVVALAGQALKHLRSYHVGSPSGDSLSFYGTLFDSIPLGICNHQIVYNGSGEAVDYRLLDINPRYEKILELSRNEVIGKRVTEVYGTGEAPYLETYAKTAETGIPVQFETYFPVMEKHFAVSVLPSGQGKFITVFEDITARKIDEKRIKHLNQVLLSIRNVNQLITHQKDRKALIRRACELLTERGYNSAWLVLLDEERKPVDSASCGRGEELNTLLKQMEEGKFNRCARLALEKPGVIMIDDPGSVCGDCPLLRFEKGVKAFTSRMEHDGKIYGLISVEIPSDHSLEKEEQELFREVVDDIAYALHSVELEEKRRRTEQELKSSREDLRITLQSIGDAVIATDRDGNIVRMNQVAEKLTAWKADEARGENLTRVFNIVNAKTRKPELNPVYRVLEQGETVGLANHTMLIARDGSEYQIADSAAPIRDSQGNTTGVVLVFRDVTKDYEIQEALKESKERLELALRGGDMGTWDWDVRTDEVKYDRRWAEMVGYTLEEIEPHIETWESLVHPEDLKGVYKKLKAHLDGKTDFYRAEFRMKHKSGEWVWILDRGRVFRRDMDGNPLRVCGIHLDITRRKQAEQELRKREKRFRSIFDTSIDAIIIFDTEGFIVETNPAAARLYGYEKGEMSGLSGRDIVNPDYHHIFDDFREQLKQSGRFHAESVDVRKDGSAFNVEVRGSSFIYMNKPHLLAIVRDITERKRAEEEMHRRQKLESLGTVAGGIAHDFNNLLMGIFGNIEMAQMGLQENHKSVIHLNEAHQTLESARRLTSQLLTFARGGSPVLETVDLRHLLEGTVTFNLRGSNVSPRFDLPDDLWMVKADRGQIGQVIANLTINAKQSMPAGGNLYVTARNVGEISEEIASQLSGEFVKITVRDEGTGIPPDLLDKIFDPYFSTKQTGSGLGLAVVHSIINRHDGYISVESTSDIGTTFTVYLPADSSGRGEMREKYGEGEEKLQKPVHILLMDDEEIIRKVGTRMLESCGHTVDTAVEGEDALEKYSEAARIGQPYDLVLMDLTVPGGMGGREAAERLLEQDPAARIIVSSGYSSDPVLSRYLDYGFSGMLAKPFKIKELKREIFRVMDK